MSRTTCVILSWFVCGVFSLALSCGHVSESTRAEILANMHRESREAVRDATLLCRGRLPVLRPKTDYLTHSLWMLDELDEKLAADVGQEVCRSVSRQAGVFVIRGGRLALFADGFEGRLGSNIVARHIGGPETLVETCAGTRECGRRAGSRLGERVVSVTGAEVSRNWMRRFCRESLCSGSYVELLGYGDGAEQNELLLHGSLDELRQACSAAIDAGLSTSCLQ